MLYPNGDIKFNYGAAQIVQTPTVGVSGGDGLHYLLSSRDGATVIPANVSSLLTHPGVLPTGLSLSASGVLSGTPTGSVAGYDPSFVVTDSGSPSHSVIKSLHLDVTPSPVLTLAVPANATEGDGTVGGTISIPAALGTDLTVSLASGDAARAGVPASVTIPAGLTSAPVPISIVDNALLDGVETGNHHRHGRRIRRPAAPRSPSHDNETATLTVSLPAAPTRLRES